MEAPPNAGTDAAETLNSQAAGQASKDDRERPLGVFATAWIALACAVVVAVAAHGVTRWLSPAGPRFGQIDVADVMALKEMQLIELATRASTSAADREATLNEASAFPAVMQQRIKEIQASCRCLVLNKGAVASGEGVQDFTPALIAALGLQNVDVEAARKAVAKNVGADLTEQAATSHPATTAAPVQPGAGLSIFGTKGARR
jgi:hypothetical protein